MDMKCGFWFIILRTNNILGRWFSYQHRRASGFGQAVERATACAGRGRPSWRRRPARSTRSAWNKEITKKRESQSRSRFDMWSIFLFLVREEKFWIHRTFHQMSRVKYGIKGFKTCQPVEIKPTNTQHPTDCHSYTPISNLKTLWRLTLDRNSITREKEVCYCYARFMCTFPDVTMPTRIE